MKIIETLLRLAGLAGHLDRWWFPVAVTVPVRPDPARQPLRGRWR